MRKILASIVLAAPLALAPAVHAETVEQPAAHLAIAAGNYDAAERALLAERKIYRDRPELLLNLAAVYARTGRATEARALYKQVLDQKPVAMDITDGDVAGSHLVAQRGLRQLDAARMAGR
ncbi:tetratricopeptide repeat protein [Sphingomonas sp. ST-64]|uniref:Tetratricopeptide repeat protein n=1 Tax=Sphingomonas plantiphila TaxID=3163295 RepID=A0ABW8YK99_9SPHN